MGSLSKLKRKSLVIGELIDLPDGGFAVETPFVTDEGTTYLHRRRVNGNDGPLPTKGGWVKYAGHNTWGGVGFSVATDPLPDPALSVTIPPKTSRKSTRRK